jgi:hypothetical protein
MFSKIKEFFRVLFEKIKSRFSKARNNVLHPISPDDLRKALREGIVSFAFKKLDGTLRTARGTTKLEVIPIESHPSGTGKKTTRKVSYWDLDKIGWRSVSSTQEMFI